MKFYALMIAVTLSSALNSVSASENMNSEEEVLNYCSQQATYEGVVDKAEVEAFIKDCTESYKVSSSDVETPAKQTN